jgi:hypothetical protein
MSLHAGADASQIGGRSARGLPLRRGKGAGTAADFWC